MSGLRATSRHTHASGYQYLPGLWSEYIPYPCNIRCMSYVKGDWRQVPRYLLLIEKYY